MQPSKVKYQYIEDVERLDYYVPGGYHPVMIGDDYHNGRYTICHKLGFGRSATTWLAEDKREGRLVALKVSTAESVERTYEAQILSRLADAQSEHPGKMNIPSLLDSFTFSGPNGTHRCFVTDAARISIHEAKYASYHRLLHLPAARAIASQLILGLQFIHSQGIVHGDLHLGNILLSLPPDIQKMSSQQLYLKAGEPRTERVIRCDSAALDPGVPSEVVVPIWLGLGSDEITLADSSILITDFGEAFDPQTTKRFTAHTPLLLSPPESRFLTEEGKSLSFPGDIWTLACSIWEIFGSNPPFESSPATLDDVTVEHVETLGKLPERWWKMWEKRSDWFDEDGRKNVKESIRQWYGNEARDWDQRFPGDIQKSRRRKNFEVLQPDEEKALNDMLRSMLVLEPGRRATIGEVARCEWMQNWGLPEVQKMGDILESKMV
ncbi:CMGC/SRPK protein kinase [Trichophyton violaceum]|uniref:non-specific serine/threonine protein kinase n=1 Tax=Trichophyton violaceum TaxID=34388 RepID=A0A178FPS2_TRIVO|nr:CMGC/SRPK protein kinase [Trichophyton violaceum]